MVPIQQLSGSLQRQELWHVATVGRARMIRLVEWRVTAMPLATFLSCLAAIAIVYSISVTVRK